MGASGIKYLASSVHFRRGLENRVHSIRWSTFRYFVYVTSGRSLEAQHLLVKSLRLCEGPTGLEFSRLFRMAGERECGEVSKSCIKVPVSGEDDLVLAI